MITISYENGIGRVEFGGQSKWQITDIAGLGLPPKTYNVAEYPHSYGHTTLSQSVNARIITISGDFKCDNDGERAFAKAYKIMYADGFLTIHTMRCTRKIKAKCTSFEFSDLKTKSYRGFAAQFECDNPFFEDARSTNVHIYSRQDLLSTPIKFPCVFTKRTSSANIINSGDIKTEPIITVTCSSSAKNIRITKNNGEQSIILTYEMSPGEIITFDIYNRKIYNQDNVNLINYLADDSSLSDFWLDTGRNEIAVDIENASEVQAECQYTNLYVEATN